MDPVLALIGDLYQQIVDLRQENTHLREALEHEAARRAGEEQPDD